MVNIAQVKELRDKTGVGIMDAKNALEEADGNLDAALKILSEKGLATASKRFGRSIRWRDSASQYPDRPASGLPTWLESQADWQVLSGW